MSSYNYLLKLVFAAVFGISALFIPSLFLKIIFSTVAIVLLALNLKSFKILFVILAVVLFVIPASIFSNFIDSQLDWDNLWNNIFNWEELYNQNGYSYNSNIKAIQPDIYIERAGNLQINGINYEIIFDETSDQIYIPSQIDHRRNEDTLTLISNIQDQKYVIVIGSKVPYKNIRINSTGLNVEGDLEVENFDLNTTGLNFNTTLEASNLSINSTGLSLGGNIHVGNAEINASGISWHGLVDAEELTLNGAGVEIDLSVTNAEHIYINGAALTGTIQYIDKWVGTRYLSIEGAYGEVDILEPSDNEGRLDLDTQGRIKIRRKKF
jgi:energy-coupling factor transporter transmembrane protein EcfT